MKNIKIRNNTLVHSLLLNAPRTAISYGVYLASIFILIKYDKSFLRALSISLILFLFFIINSLFYRTSTVAALVEIVFLMPFILFLFDAKFKSVFSAKDFLFNLNLIVLCFSLLSYASQGFPFKLPYIHFSPDYYSSFFGMGGAKIVTIIGFFGLINNLFAKSRNRIELIISLLNFILPNFILGILCGFIALFIVISRTRIKLIFTTVLISSLFLIFFFSYINDRINNVNSEVIEAVGYHPKIYSHLMVYEADSENPNFILFGTGVGQFSSVPAIWTSEIIRLDATHEVPKLGDLKMGEIHQKYFNRKFGLIKLSRYSLSSSFNKPYTGITTMLIELGFPITLYLLYLLFKRYRETELSIKKTGILFFFFLMLLDVWHDNIWMSTCLLALNSIPFSDERKG